MTRNAVAKVLDIRSQDPEPERLALWLAAAGPDGSGPGYDIYFDLIEEAGPGDAVVDLEDLVVVIPAGTVEQVRGATLDLSSDPQGGETLTLTDAGSPPIAAAPANGLNGDVAQRLAQLLDHHVNPSIAAHGGWAELVGVEGDAALLRLGGGCQGCGMAAVTLRQGIERAITEAVPEIRRVVDVTDHAGGTNPYFQPATG